MKKRVLSVLITLVMLIGLVTVMSVSASAAGETSEIHWAVVQKDSDVILYLGNAAHVMQTGETLYADGAQGINNMVLGDYKNQPYRTWYTEITKVVVESEIQPASCAYWFEDLFKCTEMNLRLLNTGSVTSMKNMFKNCSSMTTLTWDTSKFTTANVTTMESMFVGCSALTSLDLSHFDTSNVTNMAKMFYQCTKLETLDLSSFDTSDVTNMVNMFFRCDMAYLDLSSFDLSGIAANSTKTLFTGAEILTLKTEERIIITKGLGKAEDRKYTY
jgi:surface protein